MVWFQIVSEIFSVVTRSAVVGSSRVWVIIVFVVLCYLKVVCLCPCLWCLSVLVWGLSGDFRLIFIGVHLFWVSVLLLIFCVGKRVLSSSLIGCLWWLSYDPCSSQLRDEYLVGIVNLSIINQFGRSKKEWCAVGTPWWNLVTYFNNSFISSECMPRTSYWSIPLNCGWDHQTTFFSIVPGIGSRFLALIGLELCALSLSSFPDSVT